MFNFVGFLKGLVIEDTADRSKQLILQISSSATTGTATTIIASQTADRTLTLPDNTDTISTASSIETLTNKTMDGGSNNFSNIDLPSLKSVIGAANEFLGRDGSGNVVSTNVIPAGTVVGTTDTQTLTNKSIDATTNTLTNISNISIATGAAIALTKLASLTANRVLQSDGSGIISASSVTNTTLAFLDATSSIQTQINSKSTLSGSLVNNDIVVGAGASSIKTTGIAIDVSNNMTNVQSLVTAGGNLTISGNEIQATNTSALFLTTDSTSQLVFTDRELRLIGSGPGVVGSLSIRGDTSLGGTNTITINPPANITANRTITLPDATTSMVGTDVTQTLSNKSFSDAITASQIVTPSNPAAGKDKLYFKADNNLYSLTSAGVETQITGSALINPMTTGGDVIYGGAAGTPTRLANGSLGQTLTSSGGTSAPTWSNAYGALTTVSKTATYSILTTDQVILVSGGVFTVTLPTAVGVTGKTYDVIKTDSTIANIITIGTTSGQTIRGASSVTLNTQNEAWRLISDGANWQVLDHKTATVPVLYTPTYTGFGTVSTSSMYSWRSGDSLLIRGYFTTGSVTTTKARMSLGFNGSNAPSGLTINSSIIPSTPHISTGGTWANAAQSGAHGQLLMSLTDSSTEVFFGQSAAGFVAGDTTQANQMSGSSQNVLVGLFRVPITGWLE